MKKILGILLIGILILGLILGVQKKREKSNEENLIDLEPDQVIKVLTDEEMIAMLEERGLDSDFGENILAKKYSEENSSSLENIYLAQKLLVEEGAYEPKVEFFCFGQLGEDQRIDSIEYISLDKVYKIKNSANKVEEIEKFFLWNP